jgi:hypothetical protein
MERAPQFEEVPDLGMEAFGMSEDFDFTAAFQEAITGVANATELALAEKVRRMEIIVSESTSEVYRDFVDFRAMAAQMEIICGHDHAFSQATQGNEILSGFMNSQKAEHDHDGSSHSEHCNEENNDEYEVDPNTGKKTKKKKRKGWFGLYIV